MALSPAVAQNVPGGKELQVQTLPVAGGTLYVTTARGASSTDISAVGTTFVASSSGATGARANTAVTAVTGTTLTGAQIGTSLITRTGPTAAFTDTTDTAIAILAAFPSFVLGSSITIEIRNATAFAQTIAGGTGVTATGELVIPGPGIGRFLLTETSATTVGLFGYGVTALTTLPQPASTALATVGASTLTGAAMVGALITRSGAQAGAAFTDTTDTAANIIAALPNAVVGQSWYMDILNTTNAQQTIAPGAGVTLSGVSQIAQNCRGTFLVTYSAAGAVTVNGLSIVDRGIDNFNLTADPGVSQDNTQGYGVGSIVFNTTAGQLRWWENRDASTGAAKWVFSGADYANGGTNPSSEVTQAGSSTAVMAAEGNINRQVPGVAAAVAPGAIATDNVVAVYSLPASFFDGLAGTNRGITLTAIGQFAANANTKRVKLWFNATTAVVGSAITGGTLMADTGAVTTNGGGWELGGNVFKRGGVGSNTQTVTSNGAVAGGIHVGVTAPADTVAVENAAILVAVTINNTTAVGDASLVFFEVNAMN